MNINASCTLKENLEYRRDLEVGSSRVNVMSDRMVMSIPLNGAPCTSRRLEMQNSALAIIKNQGHECSARAPAISCCPSLNNNQPPPPPSRESDIDRVLSRVLSSFRIQSVSSARTRRSRSVCSSRPRVTTIHQHAVGPDRPWRWTESKVTRWTAGRKSSIVCWTARSSRQQVLIEFADRQMEITAPC